MLLRELLGRLVIVPTNQVPGQLLPPKAIAITKQIPEPIRGTAIPGPVRQREQDQRPAKQQRQFFPFYKMSLTPYLEAQEDLGNTALKPGALIPWTQVDVMARRPEYLASEVGLRYSISQTITYVSMTDVMQRDNTLGYYTLSFQDKRSVYDAPPSGVSGWLSAQVKVKTWLDDNGMTQSAARNLGTLTDPTGLWSGFNGIAVQELAWPQSFRNGEPVFLGGVLNEANYRDVNTCANSGQGQFLNSALIKSMVMPLPTCLPGFNLQWQPEDDWYFSAGTSNGHRDRQSGAVDRLQRTRLVDAAGVWLHAQGLPWPWPRHVSHPAICSPGNGHGADFFHGDVSLQRLHNQCYHQHFDQQSSDLAFNPDANLAMVFQLQLDLRW